MDDLKMNFTTYPEFIDSTTFTAAQAEILLSTDIDNPTASSCSLANPVQVH